MYLCYLHIKINNKTDSIAIHNVVITNNINNIFDNILLSKIFINLNFILIHTYKLKISVLNSITI
jgi:hypothetical protein